MKTSALTIVVPPEIVALPDLSLAERVALSHIHEWPGTSNARLANLLGFSERGVEQMLRRLRGRGLVQEHGKGHARVHRLTFPVEHPTKCGNDENTEPHTNSGEQEKVKPHCSCGHSALSAVDKPMPPPTQEAAKASGKLSVDEMIKREYEYARECVDHRDLTGALDHYRKLKDQILSLPDTRAKYKSEFIAAVEEEETRVLACKLVFQQAKAAKMPRQKFSALMAAIAALSEEKLSQIRPALDTQVKLGTPADISALLLGETGHQV